VTRRVFQLAKELGVKSTAIVEKCKAEGIDIKNHMSTLSVGLEATIQEWFSSGENVTTIETTAAVDLDKVKTKKPRTRKKKEPKQVEQETSATEVDAPVAEQTEQTAVEPAKVAETATAEPELIPAKAVKPRRKSPKEIQVEEEEDQLAIAAEEQTITEEQAPGETDLQKVAQADQEQDETKEESPPQEPQKGPKIIGTITPGKIVPQQQPVHFVPAPAVLQGPKVIREAPIEIGPAPPRREPRRRTLIPAADAAQITDNTKATSTVTGKRRKKKQETEGEISEKDGKRTKQRTQRRRTGRRYETGLDYAGPHEWGDRDWQERQQRLAQASGTKLHRRERLLAREDSTAGSTGIMEPLRIEKATVKEPITIKELSAAIGVRTNEIIPKLMELGIVATINQILDAETATAIAMDFGVELSVEEKSLLWDMLKVEFGKELQKRPQVSRPPVVAFLGHVDHGKTSLLDRIRQDSVTAGEAGGITQHIGSYLYDNGQQRVTFLDTPGHKAFTQMRARGANLTDVVVLVIAADDGVMPQTEEAINHAKAAGVTIMVALNKMDLPDVDVNRVLGQLSEKELVPTEWGGDTEVVRTSAVTGEGINDLLEHLEYVAELRHLTAADEGPATGWVVESEKTDKQGVLATLLVKSGKLKTGDIVVSGLSHGRIRTMSRAGEKSIKEAGPSTPVTVTGLDEVPIAGEQFFVIDNISKAAQIAEEQKIRRRELSLAQRRQVTLDNLFSEIKAGELKELNVIVRADVQGSVDVLRNTIIEMNTSEVAVRILHAAVGGITESDVLLAQASNAIIIGFQVIADDHARAMAEREGVEIRLYRVIYQISDDIRKALEGMLKPRIEEKPLGRAEVLQIFRISRIGVVAGCRVTDGVIKRAARLRIIRDSVVIRDNSPIETIKRVKDDVSEVRSGQECGIKLDGFDDLKSGDLIEAYELVEISRTLDSLD